MKGEKILVEFKRYSVLLLYPPSLSAVETYYAWVKATGEEEAIALAQAEVFRKLPPSDRRRMGFKSFRPVGVWAEHVPYYHPRLRHVLPLDSEELRPRRTQIVRLADGTVTRYDL